MMDEIGQSLSIFATIIVGILLSGLTNARLSLKHPATKAMLGEPVYLGGSFTGSLRHGWKWLSFLAVRHFRERDVLLSFLCVLQLAVGLVLIGALTGAWTLNLARLLPSSG